MIRFACICQKELSVTDDRAGASMQCPFCGKLIDVPLLSDLKSLQADGTYKVDAEVHRREANRLSDLQRSFAPTRVDEYGRDIDLRPTQADFANIGEDPDEIFGLAGDDPSNAHRAVHAPKYDPATGELIRPITIKDDRPPADPASIPVAKAVIPYASPEVGAAFPAWRILPEMLKFGNLTVLLAIFVAHVLLIIMLLPLMAGIFIIAPGFFVMAVLMMSHYGIVAEDIAVEGNDELPRPLRDLSWHDDLWGPFKQLMVSMMLCYGAYYAADYMPDPAQDAMRVAVLLFGTIAFPAIFLTMTTSGSVVNLSPDRLLRVIRALGGSYVLCVIFWGVAAVSYVIGIEASFLTIYHMFFPPGTLPWYMNVPIYVGYPMLVIGMIAMHGFCWYLALQYRKHHEKFGWAFQKHVRTLPNPPPYFARRRGGQYAGTAGTAGTAATPQPVTPIRTADHAAANPVQRG